MTPERLEQERDGDNRICQLRHDNLGKQIDVILLNINGRFDQQDEKTATALAVAKEATLKAEALATIRAEQQNEWRSTVNDIINKMLTKDAFDRAHAVLEEKHLNLARRVDMNDAANIGMRKTVTILITIVSLAIVVLTFMFEFILR